MPSEIRFKANAAERLLLLRGPSDGEPRQIIGFVGVCLVYAALLALLVMEEQWAPAPVPQAIPVEIVLEQPPEKKPEAPPAPQPQPPPQPAASDEPATDAPRKIVEKKSETQAPEDLIKAPPKSEAPSPQPAREKKEQPSAPTLATADPNFDGFKSADGFQLPKFDSVPDIDFGAAMASPVDGGNARTTYFSILYGLIMPRFHALVSAIPKGPRAEGTVVFGVDGRGRVTQRRVIQASGSRELDAAALEAIAKSSPFPPPPSGFPVELAFTYGAN